MSSIYGITLCLIMLFSAVSCAGNAKVVSQESTVKRAPDNRLMTAISKHNFRNSNY